MFTRDLGMVIPGGVVLSRFALYIRYGETRLAAQTLSRRGMPLLGSVQGHGFAEGDTVGQKDANVQEFFPSQRVRSKINAKMQEFLAIKTQRGDFAKKACRFAGTCADRASNLGKTCRFAGILNPGCPPPSEKGFLKTLTTS